MAGRKVFTSGEILTAADVNSFLMDQSVMVFADSTARGSAIPSPSEGMATYLQDVNQLQVYDGSQFGPVGSVLQVVSTTKTDTFSTTSSTPTDLTGLSVNITPTATSSKVLVIFNVSLGGSSRDTRPRVLLVRDSTPIGIGDSAGNRLQLTTGGSLAAAEDARAVFEATSIGMQFLDTPASVSSLTYKLQIGNQVGTAYVNRTSNDSDTTSIINARLISSITVMEIAG